MAMLEGAAHTSPIAHSIVDNERGFRLIAQDLSR
jgi:hypothetical protein